MDRKFKEAVVERVVYEYERILCQKVVCVCACVRVVCKRVVYERSVCVCARKLCVKVLRINTKLHWEVLCACFVVHKVVL